jgi:pyruvate dehydrogenase (quinone)
LIGDCRTVLRALLPLIERKKKRTFLEDARDRMKDWRELMKERATRHDMPMKPQVVTYELGRLLDDDAIVTTDSGTIATWVARYIDIRRDMKFSLSGSLATMGNGVPYSIGAAIAYPKRQVVCVVGDGGFTMLMGELATLVKYDLRVKIIIIKNNVLGMIKWEQMVLEGNPQFGVELQPIDFEAYAKACGAGGFTIENPKDAEATLEQALAYPGPAVVQAVVDANEPPMPGKITTKQAINFGKAILRGQKDGWEILKTVAEDKVREVV